MLQRSSTHAVHCRRLALLIFGGFLALAPGAARASSSSKLQVERGRDLFEEGKWDDAVKEFEGAIKSDPRDIEGHYYLGLAQGAAGRWEEAKNALLNVLAIRDDYQDTQYQLGVAYYHLEQYQEGLDHLKIAKRQDAKNPRISYYEGLIYHKAQDFVSSPAPFETAASLDPSLALNSHYYAGVGYYHQNKDEEALKSFREVIRLAPGSPTAQSAQQFINTIEGSGSEKRYEIDLGIGGQYDTNLRMESQDYIDNQDKELEDKNKDGLRSVNAFLFLTGWGQPVKTKQVTWTLRGSAYNSYHPDDVEEGDEGNPPGLINNNRWDMLDLSAGTGVDFNHALGAIPLRWTVGYDYHYANLDDEAYYDEHRISLASKIAEVPTLTYTDLRLGYRLVSYDPKDLELLSGKELGLGLSQYIFFKDRITYVMVGGDYRMYTGDKTKADLNFDHNAMIVSGAVHLPFVVALDLTAEYEQRTFDTIEIDNEKRKDAILRLGAAINTTVAGAVNLMLGFQRIQLDTDPTLDYTRNILTLTFAVLI